ARRHTLLVPVAFASLAAAGVVAARGAGEPVRAGGGAVGHLAQLLALAGLFAALVGIGEASGRAAVREPDGPGGDAGAREPGIRTGGRSEEDPGTTAVLPPVPASAPPPPPPAPGPPARTGQRAPGRAPPPAS